VSVDSSVLCTRVHVHKPFVCGHSELTNGGPTGTPLRRDGARYAFHSTHLTARPNRRGKASYAPFRAAGIQLGKVVGLPVASKRFSELQEEFFATTKRLRLAQGAEEKLALPSELQRIVEESRHALSETDR